MRAIRTAERPVAAHCRSVAVRVAVHQPVLDRTLAVQLDSTPDLSSANSTREYWVDVEHQATDLAVGGSNPSRRATITAAQRPYHGVAGLCWGRRTATTLAGSA
jgi:hypothetical protein